MASGGGNFRGTTVNAYGGIVPGTTAANRTKAAANKAQANMNANMAAGMVRQREVKNMVGTARNKILGAYNVGNAYGTNEIRQNIIRAGRTNLLPPTGT
jgi:hypothetical protein